MNAAEFAREPLFRPVYGRDVVKPQPFTTRGITRVLQRLVSRASLGLEDVSGHSTRVGAAQDMVAADIDLLAVMQAGGWKTPTMPARYAERLLAERGAAARLARMQNR
jgi:hypothetical protein